MVQKHPTLHKVEQMAPGSSHAASCDTACRRRQPHSCGAAPRGGRGRLGLMNRAGVAGDGGGRPSPLDDLVQLAPIQPDASAFRAIVDLDPAPVGHDKGFSIDGAAHRHLLRLCFLQMGSVRGCTRGEIAHGRKGA